jgi:hypothetical protein
VLTIRGGDHLVEYLGEPVAVDGVAAGHRAGLHVLAGDVADLGDANSQGARREVAVPCTIRRQPASSVVFCIQVERAALVTSPVRS